MGVGRILVTDLDGTLLGDDEALERFRGWYDGRRHDFCLVYATGRSRPSLEGLMSSVPMPAPDATILRVGTEVYDAKGRPWPGWSDRFVDWEADRVRQVLAGFPGLEPQPADAQTRWKASYFGSGLGAADLEAIRRTLGGNGASSHVVYSGTCTSTCCRPARARARLPG